MRSALLAVLATAVPLAARADLVQYDFLDVHYEGTVTKLINGICAEIPLDSFLGYEVGDSITGDLRVDLHQAPADSAPEPTFGKYDVLARYPPRLPSFVTGRGPAHQESTDFVQVLDGHEGIYQFDVSDFENGFELRGDGEKVSADDAEFLHVSSTTFDFLQGDGLLQSFDISPQLMNGEVVSGGQLTMARFFKDSTKDVEGTVAFVLSKLTVTPGLCKP